MNSAKYSMLLISYFLMIVDCSAKTLEPLALTVQAQSHKKIPLMVVSDDNVPQSISETIQKDLQTTSSIEPSCMVSKKITKTSLNNLYQKGYPLMLHIEETHKHATKYYGVRIYNTKTAAMLAGHALKSIKEHNTLLAHMLVDICMPTLVGNETCYASSVAYCKKTKKNMYQLCVADSNGQNERVLVESPYTLLAPRWHVNNDNPLVFYSKVTPLNVQLCAVDKAGKQHVVTSFEGLNMLPAFSENGSRMYVCLSQSPVSDTGKKDGNSQIFSYAYDKKRKKYVYTQVTTTSGNIISPTVVDDTTLVVCSDHQGGRPQLYTFDVTTKEMHKLTSGGSCFNPSYHKAAHKIAYSQMHNGIAQLMVYDMRTQEHKQLTHDTQAHKLECSWSPCGTKLVYAQEVGGKKRIAQLDLTNRATSYFTNNSVSCDFPAWSAYGIIFA